MYRELRKMILQREKSQKIIVNLVEQLRKKLEDFVVRNEEGQVVGKVRDLKHDKNGELNLVLSPQKLGGDLGFLLNSKYIQKVDSLNRSLFIEYTPEIRQQQTIDSLVFSEDMSQENITSNENQEESNPDSSFELPDNSEVVEEEIIRLLEEKLVVERSKQKVGEVVVRKEIETRLVQVPVKREKLIVEQVSPERKQLAEIDLGQGEVTGVEVVQTTSTEAQPTVKGEFLSPQAASDLLEAIALQKRHGCAKVRVEIFLEDPKLQQTYQKMFDATQTSNTISLNP